MHLPKQAPSFSRTFRITSHSYRLHDLLRRASVPPREGRQATVRSFHERMQTLWSISSLQKSPRSISGRHKCRVLCNWLQSTTVCATLHCLALHVLQWRDPLGLLIPVAAFFMSHHMCSEAFFISHRMLTEALFMIHHTFSEAFFMSHQMCTEAFFMRHHMRKE